MVGDLHGEVAELGIAVGVLCAFDDLRVALQAEPHLTQHPRYRSIRDRMPLAGQLLGQVTGRLRGPHQRRHRVPTSLRVHQRPELVGQAEVGRGQPLAAPSRGTHPTLRLGVPLHLTHPAGDGIGMDTRRRRDRRDPPATNLRRLHTQQQATLTLIKVRPQRRVPTGRRLRQLRNTGQSTTVDASDHKT